MDEQKIHIYCIGLSHKTASVALREQLAFTPQRLEASLSNLGCVTDPALKDILELVILSTCNRVELYAVSFKPNFDALETFLSDTQKIAVSEFSSSLYRLLDEEAVEHLFRVAAGLESAVLGESQILGQVTDAYAIARHHGSTGKVLSRLFQAAIHAGKRAHTETAIGHKPASIASVAIQLISETVPDLPAAKIMVLGAGEMAELAVEALRKRGATQVIVVNRTLGRAQELARRWDGQAAALEMLLELLPDTDIVITSTGAPHTVILPSMVEKAMKGRLNRPLVFMDIAVPRDVGADVKNISGVSLYDMDTLSDKLEICLARRQAEVPQVKAILAEEHRGFLDYLATLDIVPLIVEMRRQANTIRESELEKMIRRFPDLPPNTEQQIEALTKSIVNKILHSPTARLREEANGPNAVDYANITRELFGLD
jgi:glutamyl-tRNA reductase